MDLDYDALVVLAAVVRSGSFEAAAKSLEVTQSAISQRIKQLEERVGSILIVRGRPCVPTDDGLLLCQHVEQVSLLQHELSNRLGLITDTSQVQAARVRIAVNSDSLATWFPMVVKRAAEEINLRLEVIPDDQEFTEQSLRTGDALAVVTSSAKPVPGCQRLSLGAMEYMAVASPDFCAEHFVDQVTLEAASTAPSIAFDRKDTLPEQWLMVAFGQTATTSAHMIPSYEGHLACAIAGIGWAMMPTVTVAPLIEQGKLVELVAEKRVNVSLHWQSSTQSSEVLRLLSKIVAEESATSLVSDAFRGG